MFGTFSEESLADYSKLISQKAQNYTEVATYDFTRCVRPDGSAYGTAGQCRSGVESSARVPFHDPKNRGSKGSSYYTPLEKATARLKQLERRLNDPDYTPSEKELMRYGQLKNAIEAATGTKKTRDLQLPKKTPAKAVTRLSNVMRDRSASARDMKDALEDAGDLIADLRRATRLNRMNPFGARMSGEMAVLSRLEESYDKALKQYKNQFG